MAVKVLSIEIGNVITRVVETDYRTKNPKVYHSFYFSTPEDMFEEEKIVNYEGFANKLKEELDKYKIKTKKAVFILSSARIASRDVSIPLVKENKILSLLQANSSEYFPVDLNQYQLCYRVLDEIQQEGESKHKVMVLAVPNDMVESYRRLAQACQLTLVALDYIGNAATQLICDGVEYENFAAVKIDDDNTMITIISKGKIQLQRNFSYGISEAVRVIQNSGMFGQSLSFLDALQVLKTKKCFAAQDEENEAQVELADDLQESVRAIMGNVSRTINFYNSNHVGNEISGVVVYDLGSGIAEFEDALSDEISLPVTGQPVQKLLRAENITEEKGISALAYISCVGAAIEPVDFRLEEKAEQEKREKIAQVMEKGKKIEITPKIFFILCCAVSVVLLLLVVPKYAILSAKVSNLQQEKASKQYLADEYAAYEKAKADYEEAKGFYDMTETTSENIGLFIEELEKKMPSNLAVISLSSDSASVIMEMSVKTKREAIKVIDEISKFESIRDVRVASLTEEEDELGNHKVLFTIVCTYLGGTEDEGPKETTMEEDVAALESGNAEVKAADNLPQEQ